MYLCCLHPEHRTKELSRIGWGEPDRVTVLYIYISIMIDTYLDIINIRDNNVLHVAKYTLFPIIKRTL